MEDATTKPTFEEYASTDTWMQMEMNNQFTPKQATQCLVKVHHCHHHRHNTLIVFLKAHPFRKSIIIILYILIEYIYIDIGCMTPGNS